MKTAHTTFLAQIKNHTAFDAAEAAHRVNMIQFVALNSDAFWQRETPQGHVTGSAFVVNNTRTHTLLLHHAKLNRWVQPGGHLDETDATPAHGALREAIEETNILSLALASQSLFDIDIHPIPERRKDGLHEPAHLHYDARYLVFANQSTVQICEESLGFRWVLLRELADGVNESGLVRMAKKMF